MSEHHYEIEQRIHDVLAARDKRIEELCLEVRHLLQRAIAAEDRVKELERPSPGRIRYDEPLYGDA